MKIKKSKKDLVIRLKPTVGILDWVRKQKREEQVVVGFALEDKDVRKRAERKLKEKNLDMIIANTPAAIGAEKSTVQIKTSQMKWLKVSQASKAAIAKKIISLSEELIARN